VERKRLSVSEEAKKGGPEGTRQQRAKTRKTSKKGQLKNEKRRKKKGEQTGRGSP